MEFGLNRTRYTLLYILLLDLAQSNAALQIVIFDGLRSDTERNNNQVNVDETAYVFRTTLLRDRW